MAMPIWNRLTVPLGEFVEISGIGRTQVYKMLRSGELQSVAIGKKRMVIVASYREALERAVREQQTYTPGRIPGRPRKNVADVSHQVAAPMLAGAD